MRNGHGGARRGAGRLMGRRNLRPIGALQSILTEDEKHLGLIPVEFSGDSLEFLRATMMGKIWPTREQIYAAKSILAVEHLAAATIAGRSIDDIREDAYGDVSGYNRRWQIGRCRRVLDGGLGVGAWRPLRLVSVRIPRSSTGNLVSVQGGFC